MRIYSSSSFHHHYRYYIVIIVIWRFCDITLLSRLISKAKEKNFRFYVARYVSIEGKCFFQTIENSKGEFTR